jgi:Uma2 family endonuclease
MATVLIPTEERKLLRNVSWRSYEDLLERLRDSSSPRLTYDHGDLETMSPSFEHEEISTIIEQIVFLISGEMDLDARGLGSMTLKREDLQRGLEPDGCFYVQSVNQIAGASKVDLLTDPPPDLVVEVDITNPSIDKLPIYAQIGVPEVWRYKDDTLTFRILQGEEYTVVEESLCLPGVTPSIVLNFLKERNSRRLGEWQKLVREWVHSLKQ